MIFEVWNGTSNFEIPKIDIPCDYFFFNLKSSQISDVLIEELTDKHFKSFLLASLMQGKHVIGLSSEVELPELPLKKHYYEVPGKAFFLQPSCKGLFIDKEDENILKNFEEILSYLKSQKFKA